MIENQIYLMNNINTPSCLYWHTRWFWAQDLDSLVCVMCLSFTRLSLLWYSRPECLKFSWTEGAGHCKPITPTHYFHPPHKDQSVGYSVCQMCKQHAFLKVAVINPSVQNDVYAASQVSGFSFRMTQHVSASHDHSCTAMFGFFPPFAFFFYARVCVKKLKPVI